MCMRHNHVILCMRCSAELLGVSVCIVFVSHAHISMGSLRWSVLWALHITAAFFCSFFDGRITYSDEIGTKRSYKSRICDNRRVLFEYDARVFYSLTLSVCLTIFLVVAMFSIRFSVFHYLSGTQLFKWY